MTFEKFKQQIDLLEETRRIVRQEEEEKRKTLIENVKKEVTTVFTALGPYVGYCTEACGLTNREKFITFVEPYGFVMKIRWMDKFFYTGCCKKIYRSLVDRMNCNQTSLKKYGKISH